MQEYYLKRAVCYKRGLERINYGQTGLATTDASTGEDYCWFIPDGDSKPVIKIKVLDIFFDDVGYINGTEA